MLKYQNQCPKDVELKKHPISCVCPTVKQERGRTSQEEFRPKYMSATSADPNALMRQFYEDQDNMVKSYGSLGPLKTGTGDLRGGGGGPSVLSSTQNASMMDKPSTAGVNSRVQTQLLGNASIAGARPLSMPKTSQGMRRRGT